MSELIIASAAGVLVLVLFAIVVATWLDALRESKED